MYGKEIKRLMEENRVRSVYALSRDTGLSQHCIKSILNDNVKIPQNRSLDKICTALGTTESQLTYDVLTEHHKKESE